MDVCHVRGIVAGLVDHHSEIILDGGIVFLEVCIIATPWIGSIPIAVEELSQPSPRFVICLDEIRVGVFPTFRQFFQMSSVKISRTSSHELLHGIQHVPHRSSDCGPIIVYSRVTQYFSGNKDMLITSLPSIKAMVIANIKTLECIFGRNEQCQIVPLHI